MKKELGFLLTASVLGGVIFFGGGSVSAYEVHSDNKLLVGSKELSFEGVDITKAVQEAVTMGGLEEYREFKLGTHSVPEFYTQNEIVAYEGKLYITLQSHSNYGDESWNPISAIALFKFKAELEENKETTWEAITIYNIGDKVTYEGKPYQAKWWTKGDRPDKSEAWKILNSEVVRWDSEKPYLAGDMVTYEGKTYEAKWWTRGDEPNKNTVWGLK